MRGTFVLDSIEIEGFRGYLKPIKHSFGGKSALIFGPQGSGKSSTLNAIEWGLFGKIAYFKSAEGKSDIELINSRSIGLECKVTVILRNKTSTIEITRKKRASSKESDLSVKTDGGIKVGTEAEEFLFSELGLTHDDFYRSVYLHQESIRAIITDDPRNRDEAIDRLLGLEKA
ncbi:MAG: AAA family ATPase, partial [Candidatus Thermoplasmatota archaeon]|nr:AAA family ATPase [Candidatus Thermoplasmatota archaeon]